MGADKKSVSPDFRQRRQHLVGGYFFFFLATGFLAAGFLAFLVAIVFISFV
jgi:hypothetical protein